MSLPVFHMHQPRTITEALVCMSEFNGRYALLAGGTDLLPGYARQLHVCEHVISLSGIESMRRLSATSIGACVTLTDLIRNESILPPVLVQAARGIAGPAVRSSATVGGNLLLGGRCRFFNQSAFFRSASGSCMKAGGTECLAVVQEKSCYAISSGDLVPVMLALGVSFRLAAQDGERTVPASDFYLPDGIQANILKPSELLIEVILPRDASDLSAAYLKLGSRSAIDFSEAGVAVAVKWRTDGAYCSTKYSAAHGALSANLNTFCRGVASLRVAIGALGPCPLVLTLNHTELQGATAENLTEQIWKKLSPEMHAVRNGSFRPGYRKAMARKYLGELLERLLTQETPSQKSSSGQNGTPL